MGTLIEQVNQTASVKPPRIVIHGKPGVGKTSFAADAAGVLFMPLEDGLGLHSVAHLPQPKSYEEVMSALIELGRDEHPYKVLAIDTIDKFEPLVWQKVCEDAGKNNIEDFGYGKGYIKTDPLWIEFFHALDAIRARGMTTLILCHNAGMMIDDPQIGTYTKWSPKLHKRADALLYEWADIVGYLDTERAAIDRGEKDSQRKTRTSASSGTRVLYLEDRGAFIAKNRFDLPEKVTIPKDQPYQAFRNVLLRAIAPKKEAA